jgi:type I restriction enzyme M protein
VAWWGRADQAHAREENALAWRVPAAELLANNCNLDRKNPRAKQDITHLLPEQLAASILQKERRIAEIMQGIQKLLSK